MFEIFQRQIFANWLNERKDRQAKSRILARLERVAMGNLGDAQAVGEGISELLIHYGLGYRVYYTQRGQRLAILLCGGDKSTQARDIDQARRIAKEWKG